MNDENIQTPSATSGQATPGTRQLRVDGLRVSFVAMAVCLLAWIVVSSPGCQRMNGPSGWQAESAHAADPETTETQADVPGGKSEDPNSKAEAQGAMNDSPTNAKTGFVFEQLYLEHKTGEGHPESPRRLDAILSRLKGAGLLSQLLAVKPRRIDSQWLTAVHTPEYLARIERCCREGIGYVDSLDVPVCDRSYEVARTAVGGVLAAIDAVVEGKVENAFCAVRPPGHHALSERAMGFCLLNNVAIAARYVQQKHGLEKVLIVDWDVHHGNGTQAIFYEDPTVLYFSIHQFPFYPGTGAAHETGAGAGRNTTLNVPLPPGRGDREYIEAFNQQLLPAALDFQPDFVFISAGFDAHKDDLLGGMRVTADGFAELTRQVKGISDSCCQGRLVSVLEGGYGLEGLADSVAAHLRALMD